MGKTDIEWADKVWNPVTGCTKISEGCRNCYAERIANRFWGERKFTDVRCHEERLSEPYHWKKPQFIFVNSMSDLFHLDVPGSFIERVLRVMIDADWHTFLVLTKRSGLMRKRLPDRPYPPKNIWLGVSVEDQKTADERIPILLQTPAAKRFVSVEPMLGAVDLQGWDGRLQRNYLDPGYDRSKPARPRGPLDWIICGGETGPGARPMHPDWARSLRDQCQAAGVPFFLKQMTINGKNVKMPELDGRKWEERPE